MPRLLIATKNAHKAEEIRAILGAEWDVTDLNARPEVPAPEETGATFAENAAIKAVAASRLFPSYVLSDDSGLEVDALGGAPGVISARYAGPQATDADNRARLLRELSADAVRGKARSARFRCVMCVARDGAVLGTFDGAVEGVIINHERGEGGFGYDSLFVPAGYCETFGQLSAEVKNGQSHRARALAKAHAFLRNLDAEKKE
ncbi:MAG: RdgB/HAM1 family non-canonical purine NTP pyrophosphatase [Chthoniobacter sp.]|uniref:RdgB/HAM1 family non-canonical purine NTP pyrophosphatase n=1 Tax=Chthoniobacter sp. TaxID=2510640 RepID=UPI0032AA972F